MVALATVAVDVQRVAVGLPDVALQLHGVAVTDDSGPVTVPCPLVGCGVWSHIDLRTSDPFPLHVFAVRVVSEQVLLVSGGAVASSAPDQTGMLRVREVFLPLHRDRRSQT
ncbi:hypothetical protein CO267_18345 [Acinetobacter baumannii]|nr:hypothetical protein CO267_18345 [Acinetobacter baumannii]